MKKIFISMMLLLGLCASCEMDYAPYGALNEETAIQNMKDLASFRLGVYTSLRGMSVGGWVTLGDLQCDEFHGIIDNSNRNGSISNGIFTSAESDFEGIYGSCYASIAKANYLIDKCAEFAADKTFEKDSVTIKRYKAEGHFLRAYAYFYLADHFCESYTQTDPNAAASGACIVTHYAPTSDITKYPSRSTLAATYELIESDLKAAYEGIKSYEKVLSEKTDKESIDEYAALLGPCSCYLSSYAVTAMRARVALVKGDYANAFNYAKSVIDSKVYPLATIADYDKMWTKDQATEIIFRPYMSSVEGLASTGSAYTASTTMTSADYIPTFPVLAMYDDGDVRFDSFFSQWNLVISGTEVGAFVFLKYPGNETLRTSNVNNFCNMSKPFRTSELYLIAAEAAAKNNEPQVAANYINELRANRISGYQSAIISNANVMTEVMKERECELLGEGFRQSDLRRWGLGFERVPSHDENPELNSRIVASGANLKYAVGDYRFTWPIPSAEMDANPNLKGQQNRGYKN